MKTCSVDASQAFQHHLGLVRSQAGPPHSVVFETKPIVFALSTWRNRRR